ncbi:MAG: ATPase, T2SS/T4P/T4SS family, partial [Gemmatimonadaceae bacterium]
TTSAKHVITLENPVEFLHRDHRSSITQREIGADTESFKHGLHAAMRQDPDVIMIGEMRDADTADIAMKAAERGHLLIATLHTPDAPTTIARIVAMFAPEEQTSARLRLSETLHAVVSQRLVPRADGKGRVVVAGIVVVTPPMRELIADEARTAQLHDAIAAGHDQTGTQAADQHLAELVQSGVVAYDAAMAAASRPADFEVRMRSPSRGGVAPPSNSVVRTSGPLPVPMRPSGGQPPVSATPVGHDPAIGPLFADQVIERQRVVDPAVLPRQTPLDETRVTTPMHTPDGLPAIEGYTPDPNAHIFGS